MPLIPFTEQFDIPLLLVFLFFLFFLGLVYYLRSEDKREGYPLESDRTRGTGGRMQVVGFPPMPSPKVFRRSDGSVQLAPRPAREREINAIPAYEFPGAPLLPLGDPLVDGVGPASYAMKEDVPDLTYEGTLKIAPMRSNPQYRIAAGDPDLVGMAVVASDGRLVGTVVDIWLNAAEYFIRYLEVETNLEAGARRILAPVSFADIRASRRAVHFGSLTADQFSRVPGLASPDQITLREEDRLNGYFAGGYLYAGTSEKGFLA